MWARDHPRSRGVYISVVTDPNALTGSSPLARGLRNPDTKRDEPTRIIPARAGFTYAHAPEVAAVADHPRSRGVYKLSEVATGMTGGSSPLARGLLDGRHDLVSAFRIIPARAGFTECQLGWRRRLSDHPRSRGVYGRVDRSDAPQPGSSPLARGLRAVHGASVRISRIIPARAGFTRPGRRRTPGRGDHPRSRGVYLPVGGKGTGVRGSSPLARGLRDTAARNHDCERIIPARAGFTPVRRGQPRREPDHPRSRGVYKDKANGSYYFGGSSPLARGLPAPPAVPGWCRRIIPARAGFTRVRAVARAAGRDHPRSRGVYSASWNLMSAFEGSSPLARGLHLAIGVIPTVGHPTRGRSPSLVT